MPISESRKRANKKWNDANMKERYDRIQLVVPKGRKEVIQSAAQESGESLNAYIIRAVDTQMRGGSYGFDSGENASSSISRFFSHTELISISAALADGQTVEEYIRSAVLDKLNAD